MSRTQLTDTTVPSGDLVSLGRFSYLENDTVVTFLDESGAVRADSNKFVLEDDMYDFKTLFVTVEQVSDPSPTRPGPIMLLQNITGQTDTLKLNFPLSDGLDNLWESFVTYNLESVSDVDRNGLNGYGIWFSTYTYKRLPYPDTLTQDLEFEIVQVVAEIDTATGETLNLDMLGKQYADTTIETLDTIYRTFGRDTLTLSERGPYEHIFTVLTDSTSVRDTFPFTYVRPAPGAVVEVADTIDLDIFSQDYSLPVYDDWGWKYQGWVVGTNIPSNAIGEMTPPAWPIVINNDDRIPGHEGGLLTTGTFSRIDQPDDGDPFTLKVLDRVEDDGQGGVDSVFERPYLPGEDFLDGAALSTATNGVINSAFQLTPGPGQSASAFITLEPANKPAALDSTNFPLVAFVAELPSSWNAPADTIFDNEVKMRNWTQHAPGVFMGFPEITAMIQRQ
ncbi:hypothetical protein GF377_00795 [candidate division GN15 bacterium]|nr:hypothetical protein [candidate division GN15 bacterium]